MRFGVRRPDALVMLGLALVSVFHWAATYHFWNPARLDEPVEYWLDAMYQYGAVKSAADRGLGTLVGAPNPYLGAPAEAVWADFPASEDIVFLGVGLLSKVVGVVAAMNLTFIGEAILASICFYWVARRLRTSRLFAAIAGALFALSPFFYYRNVQHFNLMVYWFLPLGILVWIWTSGRRGLRLKERRFWIASAIAFLIAIHNNYFLNYFVQVQLLIVLLQAGQKRWRAVVAALAILGFSGLGFVLTNADTLVYVAQHGRNRDAVNRPPIDTIIYGLRPMELVIPSPLHRIPPLAGVGNRYRAVAPMTGEFPSPFLGIIGGAAFLAMLFFGMRTLVFGTARGLATRATVFSLWLIFTGMAGGLMQASQFVLGFVAFRSNNRVSILLMGLALLFAARWATRAFRQVPTRKLTAAALACGAFGLWEQSPDIDLLQYAGGTSIYQVRDRWAKAAASDKKFAALLEQTLPTRARVFQFPPMAFPESGGANGVPDYDHNRLYLFSRELRYSFGAMKGRPEAAFQFEVARLPAVPQVQKLRESGFSAAVFHLGAYQPQNVEQWAQAVTPVAPNRVIYSEARDWAAVIWEERAH